MPISANAIVEDFNLSAGVTAERKMLKTFYNDGTTASPVWEVLGSGVESSTIDYAPQTTTTTDILGITKTSVDSLEMTQDLSPMVITGGQKLPVRLEDIIARQALGEFATFPIMVVKEYITVETGVYAEIHENCTVYPESLGGSTQLEQPLNITFSNKKTLGYVTYVDGVPTFTATV